jgi:GNAT superfamily N-acetyltransferase
VKRLTLAIREILDRSDPAVAASHRLLKDNFHKEELVEQREWRHSLQESAAGLWTDIQWHLIVAELAGAGRRGVVGVATGTYLGNVNLGIIGYLAVADRARGAGVGQRLRARLLTLFRRDARRLRGLRLAGVVGEVRKDNPWLRILGRKAGVLPLNFSYVQPRLRTGGRGVPLVLYYESLSGPRQRLSAAQVRRLLYTIWRRVYRIARPMARPGFRRMLHELSGRKWIGALPLDRLPEVR